MDLTKVRNERKLEICRLYARAGWAFLPLLWAVNFVWFYKAAFTADPYPEQKEIKRYVLLSGVGALLWIIALTIWIVLYQTHRIEWGDWGESISFIIPTGSP
ncbi:gamma-secretase subunit pen-2-like [Thrips palmi]|uniref:Gamma-secretase subunit PEN-2 n=1 Tax=Thrips palmi TaxID=161013 RepID=A0A6P8YW25_THRPL|nr:gamma-secretase subunit pen-2-like [Thrips palmi]